MSALKIQQTLNKIENEMHDIAPNRNPALFGEFLIRGYSAVTLNSVPDPIFHEILHAKLCLGTLITLYDDFADRPDKKNPQLLESLYQLNFGGRTTTRYLNPQHHQVITFAESLFEEMENTLNRLPNYLPFKEILNFDLSQFYSANQYSSLLTSHPYLHNSAENCAYAHHNMGMVLAAMMDLTATETIEYSEFGTMREVFLLGQRMGRIFNVLATHKREVTEGDITGELPPLANAEDLQIAKKKLNQEILDLYAKIKSFSDRITTFSVESYLEGLLQVEKLHKKMEGTL
ncbi:hypothetical protein K2X30_14300 [bacterium]|jgi:hypothetical protein|nr:hypothetical protein [bacterium]